MAGMSLQLSGSNPAPEKNVADLIRKDPYDPASLNQIGLIHRTSSPAQSKNTHQIKLSSQSKLKLSGSSAESRLRNIQNGKVRPQFSSNTSPMKKKIEIEQRNLAARFKNIQNEKFFDDPKIAFHFHRVSSYVDNVNLKQYQNTDKFDAGKIKDAAQILNATGTDSVTQTKKYQMALHVVGFGNFLAQFGDKHDGVDGRNGPFTKFALNEYRKSRGLGSIEEAKVALLKEANSKLKGEPVVASTTPNSAAVSVKPTLTPKVAVNQINSAAKKTTTALPTFSNSKDPLSQLALKQMELARVNGNQSNKVGSNQSGILSEYKQAFADLNEAFRSFDYTKAQKAFAKIIEKANQLKLDVDSIATRVKNYMSEWFEGDESLVSESPENLVSSS